MPSHMRPPFIPTDPLLCRADIAADRPSYRTAAAQSLCIISATPSGLAARRFRQGLKWLARYRARSGGRVLRQLLPQRSYDCLQHQDRQHHPGGRRPPARFYHPLGEGVRDGLVARHMIGRAWLPHRVRGEPIGGASVSDGPLCRPGRWSLVCSSGGCCSQGPQG